MLNFDSSLGISIKGGRMVLAVVQKGFQGYNLKGHLIVDDFMGIPRPELASRVSKFAQANGFNRENIILGLPRDQVIVREVELPAEVEENLDQVLRFQVEKFEPVEGEHSCFDYRVIKKSSDSDRVQIQLTMVRQSQLEAYLELFRALELFPAAVRFSSIGLQHALFVHSDGYPKKAPALLIRLESDGVECVVATEKVSSYSGFIPSPTVAEMPPEQLFELLTPFLSELGSQVDSVSNIYFSGERAAEFHETLAAQFPGCEVLARKLEIKRKASAEHDLDAILPAIGLAVSGLARGGKLQDNLIPASLRVIGGRPRLIATVVLTLLLIGTVAGLVGRSHVQNQRLLAEVNQQIAALQGQVDAVFKLRDEVSAKREEFAELQDLMKARQDVLLVLKDLTERIPDDSYLSNYQIQGDSITLQGYSDQASALVPILLESPYLAEVKTNWIQQDRRNAGKERFNFAATMK